MPDYSLSPNLALVFGRKGSGKTSFVLRYLVNRMSPQPANDSPAACTFIFDYKLEASQRLGVKACTTERQCRDAIADRLVIVNPRPMFPPLPGENFQGADARAFRWFCHFVMEAGRSGPGRKVVLIDEMRRFIPSRSDLIPLEVDQLFREGRIENIELVLSTQQPRDFAKSIREEVTEWVCFNINEPDNLDAVRPYFSGVDAVTGLQRGEFIAFNRESGAVMRSRIF
jgi:DNA helicase HerA-like ATPase